jgi:hypothetical protein
VWAADYTVAGTIGGVAAVYNRHACLEEHRAAADGEAGASSWKTVLRGG